MPPRRRDRTLTVVLTAFVLGVLLIPQSSAWSSSGGPTRVPPGADKHFGPKGEIDANVCAENAQPGVATCLARGRIDSGARALTPASGRAKGPGAPPGASPDTFVGDDGAYSPAYLQSAYNAPSTNAGATVAIVDAYDDSRAESDLAYYRSHFGLAPCTTDNGCFRKVDERGGTNYPQGDQAWGNEISLDVDMVSAICPNCNILLVEADSNSIGDLGAAVNEAVALGATVVSNSWGGAEYSGEDADNARYFDHPGIPIVFSSGDSGYGAMFPAASPDVVAAGGTSLRQATATGTRNATETAWIGSGAGCSRFMPKPSWQHDSGCSGRSMADVSAVADPQTGVWVWDTYPNGGGWGIFGGTSVSAPIISALYALAGNSSNSNVEMASTLYGDPSDLNDITSGVQGGCGTYLCGAGPGYDGPTGLGTPNGIGAFLLSSAAVAPPTVSISSPASGATVSGATAVQVNASSGVGIAKVSLAVDGTVASTQTVSPWTFSVDTTKLANGAHAFTATATDVDGNSTSAQVSVNVQNAAVDTKAPSSPSGLHLAVAGTTQAAVYWSASTDNVGVAGYYVYRDGVRIAQTKLSNFFDTGLAPSSGHVYSVRAFDAAGNVSNASSNLNAKTASVSTSATGTVAGVIYSAVGKPVANLVVTLTGNGATKTAKTSNAGVFKFSSLPAGTYTVTFTAPNSPSASPPGASVTAVAGQTVVTVDAS
jgi:hypothetical protein